MNILILSAGTRNKIIQYFKKALNGKGKIIAADMSFTAPAIYEADCFYIVSKIDSPGYIDEIIAICEKEKIDGVLSLIDPELSLLAKNRVRFENIGVKIIGSSYECAQRAYDKMKMMEWLKNHHYPYVKSYTDKCLFDIDRKAGKISFPVIVKPIQGSASIDVYRIKDEKTLDYLFSKNDHLLIQEYIDGQEIGADVYIDMISHSPISIFTKKKLRMRAGETDKSVSFKEEALFDLIERFVSESGFSGPIDIDLFERNGEYIINEVNPRFGGGYPHAYECGLDFMKMIVNNLEGNVNEKDIGSYKEGVYMMKYSEIVIRGMKQ